MPRFMKVHPYALALAALAFPSFLKSGEPDLRADPLGVQPEQFAPGYSNGLGNIPKRKTWEGPLRMEDAINLALAQNLDILKAIREIERAQGSVVSARAAALPHLALNSRYAYTDPELIVAGARAFTQSNSWNVDFTVTQNIYSGGRVSASIAEKKFLKSAAYFTLRDTIDKVIGQVRQQFSDVLVKKALIEVSNESVELASQQLKDAQNRFNAGTVPRFNVLRAEVEVASVRPQLIRAKNEHLIAQLQLAKTLALEAAVTGKPPFECAGELDISERSLDLANALALARARRPSLKALREQILAEKEAIKQANAGFKPQIDLSGGYRFQNNPATLHLDEHMEGYFLGVTGSWKIFDSFETMGLVAQAKAKFRSATLAYEDSVRQVELDVQKSFADLTQYRETIESQQKNVQQALEALRLAQERLSAGAGTQLEVLDARVALTRARTTELQARGEYVRSLAEFDRATATETVYQEEFNDPLAKLENKVLKRDYSFLFRP